MDTDFVRITFVPGTDERDNAKMRTCIGEVQAAQKAIKQAGGTGLIPVPQANAGMTFDSLDEFFKYLIPISQAVSPVLGAALGAWISGHAGRKVRLKDGDIEVEAPTGEEARIFYELILEKRKRQSEPSDEG
jgi:hypothetical protein